MIRTDRPEDSELEPVRVTDDRPLKAGDYILDCIDDSRELLSKTPPASNSGDSFLEAYIKHHRCFHFHFGLRSTEGKRDLGQYCALFEAAVAKKIVVPGNGRSAFYAEMCAPRKDVRDGEQFMFVSRIKFVKEPEGLHLWVRSHVWLAPSDFVQCIWMNPDIELSSLDHLVKSGLRFVDRKQRVSVAEFAASESPSKIIESGTRVVDAVADHQSPSVSRYWFQDCEIDEILRLFTIVSFVGGEGLRVEKGVEFFCNSSQMFFGSPNFLPAFPER